MTFEILIDKHFNVKEIWAYNKKVLGVTSIKVSSFSGSPQKTYITLELLPHEVEFKFWEDEYGTGTKKNLGK